MVLGLPPVSLKPCTPYLQRANELDKREPAVAYYCRYFAVQVALELRKQGKKDQESTKYLQKLMDKLEEDKKNACGDTAEGSQKCESFALTVFHKADHDDMAGKMTGSTAKTYYAASLFFDICQQFQDDNELPPDLAEKRKYAKWRAAEITKALKEGRDPLPPPDKAKEGGEDGVEGDGGVFAGADDPRPSDPLPPAATPEPMLPPAYTPPASAPAGSSDQGQVQKDSKKGVLNKVGTFMKDLVGAAPKKNVDTKTVIEAQKYARYAVSALQYEDLETAVENLQKSLKLLTD